MIKLHAPEQVPIFSNVMKHGYRYFISILTKPDASNVLHQFVGKLMLTGCHRVVCFLGFQSNLL